VILLTPLILPACQPSGDDQLMVGQLESDRIELTAEFSEPIISRSVMEGDRVSAGSVIIEQDLTRASAKVRQAEATVSQYQARLDELTRGPRKEQIVAAQANVDGATKDLAFRHANLERIQELIDRELASPVDLDRAQSELDISEANFEFTTAQLSALLTGTTIEELNQAQAAVEIAKALLDQATIDLDRLTTVAPVDGVVDSFLFEPGERPNKGQPMVIMLAGQQPYARIYVPASVRASVAPGDKVDVFVYGIDQPIAGRFRWIASEAAFTPYFALTEHDRGRLTYLAKVDIDVDGARLPDGITVEVVLVSAGDGSE
jgi:HlyD family secretion protein